jgi:membrane protein YqaA with SNARE-associated domain
VYYVALAGIVFAVNLMPALGPPSWAVLALLMLNWHLNAAAAVIIGALAAGTGRYVLARVTRLLRSRLSEKRRKNLEAAQDLVTKRRTGTVLGVGLFALSPLPSAQLFEAAGLLALPLLPLTLAFFAGRIVSYSIYVTTVAVASRNYGDVLTSALRSPTGMALQVVLLVGLVLLARIDFGAIAARRSKGPRA